MAQIDLCRRQIVKGQVRAIIVVEGDDLTDCFPGLGIIDKAIFQAILDFEGAIHAFSQGVLITIAGCSHAGACANLLES